MCDLLEVVPRQPAAPLGGFLGNKGEMNGGLAGLAWRWIGWRRACAARVELRGQAAIVPLDALVAQLDRASDFESEGREFESLRARQRLQVLRPHNVFAKVYGVTFGVKIAAKTTAR